MSNAFYTPGEQRAAKVNDLFAAIARRYDLLNDLQSFGLHRRWKRRVVELAAVQSGNRALDLCCGTGDLALALARRGAEVIGFDFSQAMLEIAETRRRKNFKSQISNLKSNPQSATPINRGTRRKSVSAIRNLFRATRGKFHFPMRHSILSPSVTGCEI